MPSEYIITANDAIIHALERITRAEELVHELGNAAHVAERALKKHRERFGEPDAELFPYAQHDTIYIDWNIYHKVLVALHLTDLRDAVHFMRDIRHEGSEYRCTYVSESDISGQTYICGNIRVIVVLPSDEEKSACRRVKVRTETFDVYEWRCGGEPVENFVEEQTDV